MTEHTTQYRTIQILATQLESEVGRAIHELASTPVKVTIYFRGQSMTTGITPESMEFIITRSPRMVRAGRVMIACEEVVGVSYANERSAKAMEKILELRHEFQALTDTLPDDAHQREYMDRLEAIRDSADRLVFMLENESE